MTEKEIKKIEKEMEGSPLNWRKLRLYKQPIVNDYDGYTSLKYEVYIIDNRGYIVGALKFHNYNMPDTFADLDYKKYYEISDLLKGHQETLDI